MSTQDTTRDKAIDLIRIKAEFVENLLIVFAELRSTFRSHFGHTVDLNRTADCRSYVVTRAFDRDYDVIRAQLRIVDDFLWTADGAKRNLGATEDLVPMRHRFRSEHFVKNGRQLRHVFHQLLRI